MLPVDEEGLLLFLEYATLQIRLVKCQPWSGPISQKKWKKVANNSFYFSKVVFTVAQKVKTR